MLRAISIFCLLLSGAASSLWADALNKRQIPAAAVWVIHFDADAARGSNIGQRLRDDWLQNPQSAKAIEQARESLGLDLFGGVHSITVYGTDYAPDAGVVIAKAAVDHQRIERLLKTLPGYRSEERDGHTIYFWQETAPNRRHDSAGTFFGDDQIVIAPDGTAVMAALAVLESREPSLSNDSPLAIESSPGAILQAAATGLAKAKQLPIKSPVVRQCESGSLTVGEQQGTVFFTGRIVTGAADTASRLCDLMVGAKAMAQFQNPENPDLSKLLRPLKISASDKTVEVQWQYSSSELVKIIESLQARLTAATQPAANQ